MKLGTRFVLQSALIAAINAGLTLLLSPISFGPIQLRLSEVLTVLPAIMPSSIPGLVIGCLLANFFGQFGIIDIVFGSLATLLAALSTYALRRSRFLFPLPPALFNGLIVGYYVYFLYDKTYPLIATMLFIALSELVICYGLGLPFIAFIRKNRALSSLLGIDPHTGASAS